MRLTITEEMLAALERASDKPDWLIAQVERMRRQIDYHLAHARAAASGSALGASCAVRPSACARRSTRWAPSPGR